MFEFAKTCLHFRKKSVFIFRLFKKFIIKQLVNSVFAFYHELSNIVTVLFASTFCFGFDNSCLTSSDNRFLVAEAKKKKTPVSFAQWKVTRKKQQNGIRISQRIWEQRSKIKFYNKSRFVTFWNVLWQVDVSRANPTRASIMQEQPQIASLFASLFPPIKKCIKNKAVG